MSNLYISFPQWQGAGNNETLYNGSLAISQAISSQYPFDNVDVKPPHQLLQEDNIIGKTEIYNQFKNASKLIKNQQPERVFSVGGDCGIELAPIDYLNQKLAGQMMVLWIDAHADLNTPLSSPSKEFHGMPLRTLLNDGEEIFTKNLQRPLKPSQVFLIGTREFDEPEHHYIKSTGIRTVTVDQMQETSDSVTDLIIKDGIPNVYLHIDLDVLEPQEFSSVKCPTEKGLSVDNLLLFIQSCKAKFNIVGGSVLEYTHTKPTDISNALKIARSLFE